MKRYYKATHLTNTLIGVAHVALFSILLLAVLPAPQVPIPVKIPLSIVLIILWIGSYFAGFNALAEYLINRKYRSIERKPNPRFWKEAN